MTGVRVVIPYRPSTPERRAAYKLVHAYWSEVIAGHPVVADDPNPGPFNRGRALAAGVDAVLVEALVAAGRNSVARQVLVLADADIIPDTTAIYDAIGALTAQPDRWAYAVPFSSVQYLGPDSTSAIAAGAPVWNEPVERTWPRLSTGGITIVTSDHYIAAGGFDPRFAGWGYEDAAWDIAARTLTGLPVRWIDRPCRHLWHPEPPDANDDARVARSLDLVRRYEAADGNRNAVVDLIAERSDR